MLSGLVIFFSLQLPLQGGLGASTRSVKSACEADDILFLLAQLRRGGAIRFRPVLPMRGTFRSSFHLSPDLGEDSGSRDPTFLFFIRSSLSSSMYFFLSCF